MKFFRARLSYVLTRPLLLGYLILATAYLPGVLTTNFWSDDFPALIETRSTTLNLISDTRPVWGGGIFLFFTIAKVTGVYIVP